MSFVLISRRGDQVVNQSRQTVGERARLLNSEHALRMDGASLWKVEGKRLGWIVCCSDYFGDFSGVQIRRKTDDDRM